MRAGGTVRRGGPSGASRCGRPRGARLSLASGRGCGHCKGMRRACSSRAACGSRLRWKGQHFIPRPRTFELPLGAASDPDDARLRAPAHPDEHRVGRSLSLLERALARLDRNGQPHREDVGGGGTIATTFLQGPGTVLAVDEVTCISRRMDSSALRRMARASVQPRLSPVRRSTA